MNIRKRVDYSEMYDSLDKLMAQQLPPMELYCGIGKAVSRRSEKGAAVAAAEYLIKRYPDVQGFSPRNLRRMRDFYRAYEDQPALLSLALRLCWTQNVVILEADLPMELRGWYLMAASQFGWSKAELIDKIATNAHEIIALVIDEEVCNNEEHEEAAKQKDSGGFLCKVNKIRHLTQKVRRWMESKKRGKRRRSIASCRIFAVRWNAFVLEVEMFT